MKILIFLLFSFFIIHTTVWLTDFSKAQKIAIDKHQLILVNFSGSDWCGPCIRLKKEIFESKLFQDFADSSLVLVNADFPRSSKNKLAGEQVKLNESLADRYNPKGKFPFTLLTDADGKILFEWDGLPAVGATLFIQQIQSISNAHH